MIVLSIDPGPQSSSFVLLNKETISDKGSLDNSEMATMLYGLRQRMNHDLVCVIEKIESMGMAVGASTFETVYWSGIFAHAFGIEHVHRITRRQVKLYLCGSMRAKDANIRQALIDRYGGTPAIKKGGALYKIASHQWSALAVAVTYLGLQKDMLSTEEQAG